MGKVHGRYLDEELQTGAPRVEGLGRGGPSREALKPAPPGLPAALGHPFL